MVKGVFSNLLEGNKMLPWKEAGIILMPCTDLER
jgi:hypothetical protein